MTSGEDDHLINADKINVKVVPDHEPKPDSASQFHRLQSVDLAARMGHPVLAEQGVSKVIEDLGDKGHALPFETMVQGHIGRQLRALYDDILEQPVPDRFLTLLQQLDQASRGAGDKKGD